jgi:hypothetical protein
VPFTAVHRSFNVGGKDRSFNVGGNKVSAFSLGIRFLHLRLPQQMLAISPRMLWHRSIIYLRAATHHNRFANIMRGGSKILVIWKHHRLHL